MASEYVSNMINLSNHDSFSVSISGISYHNISDHILLNQTSVTVSVINDRQWNIYLMKFSKWFIGVSILNLIGNLTILCLIKFSPTFRKPANYLIGNLSAASLLYMATMLKRVDWARGPVSCQVYAVLHKIPGSVVSLTLLAISLDRNRVILNPFSTSPKISAGTRIVCIWLLSITIVVPYYFTKSFRETQPQSHQCVRVALWDNPMYNILYGLFTLLVIYIIPAIVLLSDVSKMLTTMKFLSLWPKKVWNCEDRRVTLMRNSCIYALVFIMCWLPIGIFRYPLDLPPSVVDPKLRIKIKFYWDFYRMIGYLNMALHPIFLFALSHDLRRKISICFV